jgi:signal transduction histidine kinase
MREDSHTESSTHHADLGRGSVHELPPTFMRGQWAYLGVQANKCVSRFAPIGSWATNLVTRQVFHSSAENNRLYGFDVSQYPNPFDLHYSSILVEDEPALTAKLENAVRAGADFDVEYRIRRSDGTIRSLRGIGHHNPAQEFGEYFGITIDITDRKRTEEERERLRQLETDLAHINRVNMMGELAAALAHEIKQPIAAAVANAGACLGFLDGEHPDILEAREAASGTIGCGRRAAEIIDHVRSLFKKSLPRRRSLIPAKPSSFQR